jgi:hypothetical protein
MVFNATFYNISAILKNKGNTGRLRFMVFNATFYNISAIQVMEKMGITDYLLSPECDMADYTGDGWTNG